MPHKTSQNTKVTEIKIKNGNTKCIEGNTLTGINRRWEAQGLKSFFHSSVFTLDGYEMLNNLTFTRSSTEMGHVLN